MSTYPYISPTYLTYIWTYLYLPVSRLILSTPPPVPRVTLETKYPDRPKMSHIAANPETK